MPLKKKNGLKMLSSYEELNNSAEESKHNSEKSQNNKKQMSKIDNSYKLQSIKKELEKLTVKPKYIKIILKKD